MMEPSILPDTETRDAIAEGGNGAAHDGARAPATDVFGYEDYRSYMRDRFAELQARTPEFSQRGLARKARIANPGFFNEVVKGRRRLSPAAAAKMAAGLGLSALESEYFSALVRYVEAREPLSRLKAGRRMIALRNRQLYRKVHAIPTLPVTLREILGELEKDWVLLAAGLSADTSAQDGLPPAPAPLGESGLHGILEELVCLRSQADGSQEPRVIEFSLKVAPRPGPAPD